MNPILDLTAEGMFTTFPDGQPHCALERMVQVSAIQGESIIEVNTRLRSAQDVVHACIALDALDSLLAHHGLTPAVRLNVAYMLGARMDRRIAPGQPATLHVLASLINASKVDAVQVLDPHSAVTLDALDGASALHPDLFVREVLAVLRAKHGTDPVVVIPDKGAVPRTTGILRRIGWSGATATCSKQRDSRTGSLSAFALEVGNVAGAHCLIVDDICDGGATFAGVAALLRQSGARTVELAVTHGIFSKGLEISQVDCLYSTDSYGAPSGTGYEIAPSASQEVLEYRRPGETAPRLQLWTNALVRILREGQVAEASERAAPVTG